MAIEKGLASNMVLLRHGRTIWNRAGILIGQQDIPLDAGGRREARSAIPSLAGIDAIYSSPLARCRETACIIGDSLGISVKFLGGLAERNWGVFEGRPKLERDHSRDPEHGEKAEEFRVRVAAALQQIAGVRPLIVTHSGVIRLICGDPNAVIPHAEPIELPFKKVASQQF